MLITMDKGWRVTIFALGVNLASGMMYSWSVFAAALVKDLGYTKTEAMLPYTIALAVYSFFMIPGGWLQDRLSPRLCITVGGVLAGTGFIIAGFIDSLIALSVAFGIITGIGLAITYAATTPTAVKWFPAHKRGLISGLVVAGSGLTSVYAAPMTQYFINIFGVKKTFWVEGLLFMAAIVALAQFMAKPPKDYIPFRDYQSGTQGKSVVREYAPGETIRTPQFWLLWLVFGCGSVAGLMIIGHMAIIAQIQANIAWGFVFVALLAIFNSSGRVVGGFLSDRLGRTRTLFLMLALQAANMLIFRLYDSSTTLMIGIAVTGIAYGSLLSIMPAITYDYFGLRHGGTNLGLLFTAWGLASIVGPSTAAYLVDQTGIYNHAYYVAAAFLVFSIILVRFIDKPEQKLSPKIDCSQEYITTKH